MRPNIHMGMNPPSWTESKLASDRMGGTQRFLKQIADELTLRGYEVFDDVRHPLPDGDKADVVIHDNGILKEHLGKGDKHILYAGSWHAPVSADIDLIVFPTEFCREKFSMSRTLGESAIIPCCIGDDLFDVSYAPRLGNIVCHSNPNRHFPHTAIILNQLNAHHEMYKWRIAGGNSLYRDDLTDSALEGSGRYSMFYEHLGVLDRKEILELLRTAHLWVYPYFTHDAETFCIAACEAAAVGIPVILPDRPVFKEVLPDAEFLPPSTEEFSDAIREKLSTTERREYPSVRAYKVSVVADHYEEAIEQVCKPTQIQVSWQEIPSCTVSEKLSSEMVALERWCEETKDLSDLAIEIGSYHGMSTALIAQYYQKIIAIDLWGNVDNGLGNYQDIGQHHFLPFIQNMIKANLIERVTPIVCTSVCLDLFKEPLNAGLIFIDADHHYEPCRLDIQRAKRHVAVGGLIVGHDYKRPGYGYPPYDPNHPHHGPKDPWGGVGVAFDELIAEDGFELYEHVIGIVSVRRTE